MNRKYNKTMLVFGNTSVHDLYYLNHKDYYYLNSSKLERYNDIDLFVIEMPLEIEHKFDYTNVSNANNTILISSEELIKLENFIE